MERLHLLAPPPGGNRRTPLKAEPIMGPQPRGLLELAPPVVGIRITPSWDPLHEERPDSVSVLRRDNGYYATVYEFDRVDAWLVEVDGLVERPCEHDPRAVELVPVSLAMAVRDGGAGTEWGMAP